MSVEAAPVAEVIQTEWGIRFKVRSRLAGCIGKSLKVVTIWQQDQDTDTIRLLTLYPDKL